MMELILWRHAEAEDGIPDLDRKLTAKGHKQAEKIAAWLKPKLPTHTHILVSPAKRTQQTAAALGLNFTTLDEIGPGADPQTILRAAGWPDDTESVLIVGHQPTLGAVAARVLAQLNVAWSVKKGAVWWLSTQTSQGDIQTALRTVVTPELL
jgi:phosphohistidine phosphatase